MPAAPREGRRASIVGARGLAIVAVLVVGGCVRHAPRVYNVTDLYVVQQRNASTSRSTEPPLDAYRALAEGVLASSCRFVPTDSTFYAARSRTCSSVLSLFDTVGRALEEPSILTANRERPVTYGGRLRWIELPPVCR